MRQGTLQIASLTSTSGWGAADQSLEGAIAQLTDEARGALESVWGRVAALEHSSVASFARFTLELMGLGAPAHLLMRAQQAAADEVQHAQEVYCWLSTLKGHPVGPGPFPVQNIHPHTTAQGVALSLIEEACVGELLGVAEVERAIELITELRGPEALKAHLIKVRDDETMHVALAWETLAWLTQDMSSEALDELALAFSHTLQQAQAETQNSAQDELLSQLNRFGLLTAQQRRAVSAEVCEHTLWPALRGVLGVERASRVIAPFARSWRVS